MASDTLVAKTITSLINGVSQQPSHLRLPSQGEAQTNYFSDVVDGLVRRPPTEHIAKVVATAVPTGGYFIHAYERDASERYIVLLSDQDIKVFDFDGNAATVNKPDGVGYLDFNPATDGDASHVFAATSIADTTIIVNRTKTVAMSGSPAAARTDEVLFKFVESTPNNTHNRGRVGVTTFVSATRQGSAALQAGVFNTAFNAALNARGGAGNWSSVLFPNGAAEDTIVHATRQTGTPFAEEVRATAEIDPNLTEVFYKRTQRFSDLPHDGPDGFTIEISGSDGDDNSNYWVKYDASENTWVETVEPGLDNAFDPDTMPYRLVRDTVSPLVFTFERIPWDNRLKGDEDTAPEPSFVGGKIHDAAYHKNRLIFLSGENVICSEAGFYFNFWPTTVTTLVDSDPIDTSGVSTRVTLMDYAVPFDEKLTLFSPRSGVQHELASEGLRLTPTDAVMIEKAAYSSAENVRPEAAGKSLFFAVDRTTATGLMEYTIAGNERPNAEEVSAHVPTYIPGGASCLTISANESVLAILCDDDPTALFFYRWYYLDGRKVQGAWFKSTFGSADTILAAKFLRHELWIVVQRADGTHLEKMDIRKVSDGGFTHRCHLDSKVELTGVYASGTGLTTWTLPYNQEGGTFNIVLSDAGWGAQLGKIIPGDFSTPGSVTAEGDYSANPVSIGRVYESRYTLSPIVIPAKQTAYQSNDAVLSGRIQLKYMEVFFQRTGGFRAEISRRDNANDTTFTYPYTGRRIGLPGAVIGEKQLLSDSFRFPISGEAEHVKIDLVADDYTPVTISSVMWEGRYSARNQTL